MARTEADGPTTFADTWKAATRGRIAATIWAGMGLVDVFKRVTTVCRDEIAELTVSILACEGVVVVELTPLSSSTKELTMGASWPKVTWRLTRADTSFEATLVKMVLRLLMEATTAGTAAAAEASAGEAPMPATLALAGEAAIPEDIAELASPDGDVATSEGTLLATAETMGTTGEAATPARDNAGLATIEDVADAPKTAADAPKDASLFAALTAEITGALIAAAADGNVELSPSVEALGLHAGVMVIVTVAAALAFPLRKKTGDAATRSRGKATKTRRRA